MTENDILDLIARDPWMMQVLETAATLDLPDWMIGAGFVRNKVWDHLHGYVSDRVDTADIDLIYFDPSDLSELAEKEYDEILREQIDVNWSTKNQARMHVVNDEEPYTSSTDGLAHWVETPTCVAVTLDDDVLRLIAPHGIDDLVNLRVTLSPAFTRKIELMKERIEKKKWLEKWPKLKVEI